MRKIPKLLAVIAIPVLSLVMLAPPASAYLELPESGAEVSGPGGGDPGVSGCWEWSVATGCTVYADCYVKARMCFISEKIPYLGWMETRTVHF
jgi:hypothetical protein